MKFGFERTSEMNDWIRETFIAGPCSIVDNWTYGRIQVNPTVRFYAEKTTGGWLVKWFRANDWTTVDGVKS